MNMLWLFLKKALKFSAMVGDLTLRMGLFLCFPNWIEACLVFCTPRFLEFSYTVLFVNLYILTIGNNAHMKMFVKSPSATNESKRTLKVLGIEPLRNASL